MLLNTSRTAQDKNIIKLEEVPNIDDENSKRVDENSKRVKWNTTFIHRNHYDSLKSLATQQFVKKLVHAKTIKADSNSSSDPDSDSDMSVKNNCWWMGNTWLAYIRLWHKIPSPIGSTINGIDNR